MDKKIVALSADNYKKSDLIHIITAKNSEIDSVSDIAVITESKSPQLELIKSVDPLKIRSNNKTYKLKNSTSQLIDEHESNYSFMNSFFDQHVNSVMKSMPSTRLSEMKTSEKLQTANSRTSFFFINIGLYLLSLVLTAIVMITSIFIILESSLVLGVIVMIVGIYFVGSLHDFLLMLLKSGGAASNWTFVDSMKKIGILFGILAAIALIVFLIGLLFNF